MVLSAILLAATLQSRVASVVKIYDRDYAKKLVPMLTEVISFPTTQFDADGHIAQKAWLAKAANDLDLTYRDAGLVDEIELPGPPNAPVLGLMGHGDVQPAEADAWSFPPFGLKADKNYVYGRGSADDEGPLVQALLAMKSLKDSGIARTHTVRLLVGSDEESNNTDVAEYLKTHKPPDYTLVLDSEFPVVVGEKAWNSLSLTTDAKSERAGVTKPYGVSFIDAGLSASIVPDRAEGKLLWKGGGGAAWQPALGAGKAANFPIDTRIVAQPDGSTTLRVIAYGHSSHAGVNLEAGRNALVALAR